MAHAAILGTGSYLPPNVVSNADLELMVETSDEWITTRTGIKERRVCPDGSATSDLGVEAAKAAIADAGIDAPAVDMILCATISGDMPFPSTACIIQSKLGLDGVPAFDISAACSGFLYGLETARAFIECGVCRTVLVVGAECMSRFIDYTDRSTCVLLGDGSGAAVVGAAGPGGPGILASHLASSGRYRDLLFVPAGGSLRPASFETVERRMHFMKMEGSSLFRIAVRSMSEALERALAKAGMTRDDITLLVPHQANLRIITGVARTFGIPGEKCFVNIHKYGNMSAACVPIALDEAAREGRIKTGDIVATVAFGAGLTSAANIIRWTK